MSDDGDGSGSGSWLRFDQRGCRRRKTEDGRRTERRDVDEYRAEIYALINFSRHVSVRKIEQSRIYSEKAAEALAGKLLVQRSEERPNTPTPTPAPIAHV